MDLLEPPQIAVQGSLSMMVNFDALKQFFTRQDGQWHLNGELQLQGPLAAQLSGNLLQQTLAAELPATGLGYEALSLQLAAVHREQQIRIETLRLRDEPSNSQLLAQGELDLGELEDKAQQVLINGMGHERGDEWR